MAAFSPMKMVRGYVGSRDRQGGRALHEAIVECAREHGLRGATVVRGMLGHERNGTVRRVSFRRRVNEVSLVVQIVDRADRIAASLPQIETLVQGGFVSVQDAVGEQVSSRAGARTQS